jgi:hypothetical protein
MAQDSSVFFITGIFAISTLHGHWGLLIQTTAFRSHEISDSMRRCCVDISLPIPDGIHGLLSRHSRPPMAWSIQDGQSSGLFIINVLVDVVKDIPNSLAKNQRRNRLLSQKMKFFRLSLGILSSLLFIPSVWTAAIDLHTHDIQRRAYSVKIDGVVARPWPNRKLMICYKSQSDSDDLEKLIMAAYDDLWAPAGMKELFSGIERKVGCDTDSKELQVTSVRKTGNMATTVGYRSGGGMRMQFDPDPPHKMGNGDSKVAMAHELGMILKKDKRERLTGPRPRLRTIPRTSTLRCLRQ